MKKIFLNLSASATFAVAIILTSCNNAEEVKKQTDEQNAKIQTLVDEKLTGLQEEVNMECAAMVDSLAGLQFTAWQAEEAKNKKSGKKSAVKPKAVTPANPKADRFKNPDGSKTVTKEQTESKGERFVDPNAPKKVTTEDTKKKADRFKKP